MTTARAALLLAALLIACGDRDTADEAHTGPAPAAEAPFTATRFAPALGVVLDSMERTGSGVYISDLRAGSGAAAEAGRTVVVDYEAWLPDGTLYDRRPSEDGFSAAELTLGEGEPVGLHEGIAGMRNRGTRRIVVPPELGYGLIGRPERVPAGSPVIFEVRLRAVRP